MVFLFAVLGLVSALAVVPIDTRPLASDPHPITDYSRAVAAYDTLQRRERDSVMSDGASLLLEHGHRVPRAIVLVHWRAPHWVGLSSIRQLNPAFVSALS